MDLSSEGFTRGYVRSAAQGTQLAYQLHAMRTLLLLSALGTVACGARHFSKYLSEKDKRRLAKRKIEVWEGEGGAVPVHATRTAQQISPVRKPHLSPRGNG
ncbi:MAG: hypothetical protein ACT4P4_18765 [Betaproteobacteria bacterium]